MKKMPGSALFIRLAALLLAVVLLPAAALAEEAGSTGAEVEEIEVLSTPAASLPLDFTPGSPLKPENFSESVDENGNTVRVYQDSTIRVTLSEKRWFVPNSKDNKGSRIWMADVVISDPSQLRVASFDPEHDFSSVKRTGSVARGAEAVNAVTAINGDSWGAGNEKHNFGIVYRQGQLFSSRLDDSGRYAMDLLVVDMDGNFHGIHAAKAGDLDDPSVFEGRPVMDVFSFGPILVENGQVVTDYFGTDREPGAGGTWMKMLSDEPAQRAAICQVGPLHYLLVTGEKYYENRGLTLPEFAECIASLGVQFAYNLDGGQSSILYYPGLGKVNVPKLKNRDLWDFIYFASAEQ